MAEESTLKLHADLAWVLALLWIAKQVVQENLNPRFITIAVIGIGDFPRDTGRRVRSAAMAMPVPKRPTFTEAIGWRIHPYPPDDAA